MLYMGFDSKGMSGKVLSTVITLIIALFALVLLWNFLLSTSPLLKISVENITNSFRSSICDKSILNWPVINNICRFAVGVE